MGDTSPHTVAELEAQDRFHGIRDTGQALTTALTIPGAGEIVMMTLSAAHTPHIPYVFENPRR